MERKWASINLQVNLVLNLYILQPNGLDDSHLCIFHSHPPTYYPTQTFRAALWMFDLVVFTHIALQSLTCGCTKLLKEQIVKEKVYLKLFSS